MSSTLDLYQHFTRWPFGKHLASAALGMRAPYFSTIHPLILELAPGHCKVQIKDRRSIRNHIGTIHAGAMCTLSELVGGLAVDASLPKKLRWIPKEMIVRYLKKARGTLTALCAFDPGVLLPGDVPVSLQVMDSSGESVLEATILFYISERKSTLNQS
jgi:acyl-coenzyme A thioesterase PaaI-like protein